MHTNVNRKCYFANELVTFLPLYASNAFIFWFLLKSEDVSHHVMKSINQRSVPVHTMVSTSVRSHDEIRADSAWQQGVNLWGYVSDSGQGSQPPLHLWDDNNCSCRIYHKVQYSGIPSHTSLGIRISIRKILSVILVQFYRWNCDDELWRSLAMHSDLDGH